MLKDIINHKNGLRQCLPSSTNSLNTVGKLLLSSPKIWGQRSIYHQDTERTHRNRVGANDRQKRQLF